MKEHKYKSVIKWTGNLGVGTKDYKAFNRNHEISSQGKYAPILGSSDPNFLGDKNRYNPEDLFLSSIASCHMLWYLHLCAVNNITVVEYIDAATGSMEETKSGSGKFTTVTLHPSVTIINKENIGLAKELHHKANEMCFIANSCNFKIKHQPIISIKG